jgi:transcriptional regulator with XRE-family HTH domain
MLVNLKAALAFRGARQSDLALELKISTGYLSEVIHCRRELPPHLRAHAAEFLDVDETWLFSSVAGLPPRAGRGGA